MQESSRQRLLERIGPDDLVLDIGGWGDPFERADWVMDMYAYESRGLYAREGWVNRPNAPERFTEATWIQRDICDRDPFPFADDHFDFVICSHTLEDLRDPIWVCEEMQRVGKAGYIEVPSRLEEQCWGVTGELVGWPHHHWLIDLDHEGLEFVFKTHAIHTRPEHYFPRAFHALLNEDEKVHRLWWEGSFEVRERVIFDADDIEGAVTRYLGAFVAREMSKRSFERSAATRRPVDRAREALGRVKGGRRINQGTGG